MRSGVHYLKAKTLIKALGRVARSDTQAHGGELPLGLFQSRDKEPGTNPAAAPLRQNRDAELGREIIHIAIARCFMRKKAQPSCPQKVALVFKSEHPLVTKALPPAINVAGKLRQQENIA